MKRYWIAIALAASAYAADVKAFIPSLLPVKRVDAVYPDTARRENIYGRVELFVTMDAGGNVVAAEAMQGAPVLRDAAVEAVKQWTFRPAIRDGHAVATMTTASLDVAPLRAAGQAPLPTKMDFNLKDAAAYGQRLAEMQKKFPRTPQQVLADDEQQSMGDARERYYALAKLAKDAYQAGDLVKAKAYATELLGGAGGAHDWNSGNAIHDGNMVLGLVALAHGDVAGAVSYLKESGKTPGSPQLNSFGPNMTLAKALIDAGQSAAVLAYFEECRVFWKMGGARLDEWSATVKGGGKPNFGANLVY